MKKKIIDYLSRMPHFSFIPRREIRRVATSATTEKIAAGSIFAKKGQSRIDNIYVVVSGELLVFDEKHGREFLTGQIKPGEIFGGITILLNGGISLRTVKTDKETVLYVIHRSVFQDLCTRFKAFYEYFLENFSKNVFDESLSHLIATEQVRMFLAGLEPFSFLPEEELDQVAAVLSIVQYPQGTILFVQGITRVGYLYILQKGSAERYFEEGSKKTMKGILGEGDIYGGISILHNDGIAVRTLQIKENAIFYLLPKKHFLDLCDRFEAFTEFFTDTFGRRMLNRSYASIIARTLQPKEEALQFFNQTVWNVCRRKPVFGDITLSIKGAAEIMSREKSSYLIVRAQERDYNGIITESDLARKVVAAGQHIHLPVSEIISSPLVTISGQALVSEALMEMTQRNIQHLAVLGPDDQVVGVLSNRELLTAQGHSPLFLMKEISAANALDEIIDHHEQLPKVIRAFISNGAKANNVTRYISAVSDAVLKKLMTFVIRECGPPPVRYAFMIMGSDGRKEQTLKTDQDNAIIYEDVPGRDKNRVEAYFLNFGDRICSLLDQVGYAFCKGDVMAKNPKWCQPLSEWKSYFSKWIHAAEAEDLLQASIFFDFRGGYGDMDLISALRDHLFGSIGGWSGFLRHLTENALHFKPPLGFFRNFVVASKGEHRNTFDIKSAMLPIVDFARIYALKYKVEETNTQERLYQLRLKQALTIEEHEELEKAYGFLMQLRFVRQVSAVVDDHTEPDNYINPKKLTRIEQTMLKEIFKRIEKFQAKLNFDFIGIA